MPPKFHVDPFDAFPPAMMAKSMSDVRVAALFQRLKPLCVTVSDHALRVNPNTSAKALQNALEALNSALSSVDDATLITPALADYVFFPLSHILRRKDEWTERVLESAVSCVRVLLETAWSKHLAPQMFEQFCLMFLVIAEKSKSEDIKAVSVSSLTALFTSANSSIQTDAALREAIRGSKLRPLMGHTATVLLDIIKLERLLKLRIEAVSALRLLYTHLIRDGEILATFLPMTVSIVSRCLSSSPTSNHKFLIALLNLLRETLSMVMDDSLNPTHHHPPSSEHIKQIYQVEMSAQWYRATKSQIKIALESFFPVIRQHSHNLVREAVLELCEQVTEKCSKHLDVCQSLLLETILSLQHDSYPSVRQLAVSSLRRLRSHPSLLHRSIHETVEESLRTWCMSLTRTMASNDDTAKCNLLQRITSAIDYLAKDAAVVSSSLDMLITSIRGIAVFNQESTSRKGIDSAQSLQLTFRDDEASADGLSLLYSRGSNVASSLRELLEAIGRTSLSTRILDKLILEASTSQIPSDAWIALQIARASPVPAEPVEELYPLAIDWLLRSDSSYSIDEIPSPTILISLEILSFAASVRRLAFRENLMETLYPTLSLLSHSSPSIQSSARQVLERIAIDTGHSDVRTLILRNTDYLVNSIGLKLDVFDISVQVLATLYTVTKLAGPAVVPYLDDIWARLFDVVDRFHGYERLATGVFAVMTGIVDALSQSITFPSPPTIPQNDTAHDSVCRGIQDLIDTIKNNKDPIPPKETAVMIPKPAPLPLKTASVLQSAARKSVLLSTHPSPNLRFNLIHLLRKSFPLLSIPTIRASADEQDPFLPLLAQEIWPAVCSKLTDPEPWIVNAALDTLAEFIRFEGEFLGTKVEKDVWPALKRILTPGKRDAQVTGDGGVRAVCSIILHSDLNPALFDEMLETCWPLILRGGDQGTELRNAFQRKNADAVWLMEYIDGQS